jgi:hypothetical protein
MELLTNGWRAIKGLFVDDDDKKRIKDKQKKCHADCDETAKKEYDELKNKVSTVNVNNVKPEQEYAKANENEIFEPKANVAPEPPMGGKSKKRKGLKNRRRKTRRSSR